MTIHESHFPSVDVKDIEKRNNIGVGTLIVNMDGKIYTVRELQRNKDTERVPGQISISTEKSKVGGEHLQSNVLGALGEFCNDKDIPELKDHLFMVGLPRITPVDLDGKSIACSLVTLVCDINIQPKPAHSQEVDPYGWYDLNEIMGFGHLRPLSRQLLEVVNNEKLVEKGIDNFRKGFMNVPILKDFSPSNSFDNFIIQRNLLSDSYVNGVYTNGHTNGNTNGQANGHTNGNKH